MSDSERLSPGNRVHIIAQVQDGVADEWDARYLLADFVTCVSDGDAVPTEVLEYLRDAFRDYLAGTKKLDDALGLKRKDQNSRGPRQNPRGMAIIAMRVWEERLKGVAHQEALEIAAHRSNCGTTKAGNAWRDYKREGLDGLRIKRSLADEDWTIEECHYLREICQDVGLQIPGFASTF